MKKVFLFLAPIPAILAGAWVCHKIHIPLRVFGPNLIAVLLGIPFSLLLNSLLSKIDMKYVTLLAVIAVAKLALTFYSPGMEGVHRWFYFFGYSFNMSMFVCPFLLLYMASASRWYPKHILGIALVTFLLLILQPDAGQATAFGLASLFIFASEMKNWQRTAGIALALACIVLSWFRKDPLLPVDHVEKIMKLSMQQGLAGWIFLILGFQLSITPYLGRLRRSRRPDPRWVLAGASLVYLIAQWTVPFFGNFPVPLMGSGAAPVFGWYVLSTGWVNRTWKRSKSA